MSQFFWKWLGLLRFILFLIIRHSKSPSIKVSSYIHLKSLAYAFNSESFNIYQNSQLLIIWRHLEETQNCPQDLSHNKNQSFFKEKRKSYPITKADH
jgi:hypothetical protein